MKILVTTPTGKIGRLILRELMAPEFSVRVIARDPARLPADIRRHVEIVCGSTDDAPTLRHALEGVEALFWCVPGAPLQETDMRGHYERFARAACQAIQQAKIPRVVTISAFGNERVRNAGPISALHGMEEILNNSGAAIRHLRCGAFMENLLWQAHSIIGRGVLSYPIPSHVPIPMVATTDIADAALRWLVRRDWDGIASVSVRGPDDLSYGQVAANLECVLGHPVRYQEASPNQFMQTLVGCGASLEFARDMVAMYTQLAAGITRTKPRKPERNGPISLATWIERELAPLATSCSSGPSVEPESCQTCHG